MQTQSAAQPNAGLVTVRQATAAEAAALARPQSPPDAAGAAPGSGEYIVQQASNGTLRLTVYAGAADDTRYAPNGGEWPSPSGPVRLKYEVRNLSAAAVDDITLVDDNGTPNNPNDDILVSKDIVGQGIAPGASIILHRNIVATGAVDSAFVVKATLTGTVVGDALPPVSDSALIRITARGPKSASRHAAPNSK
ncbi:MAG: hypothetical protein NTZ05_15215 [Chloroflexi bacterium]|nr:hypothetical protein [Chloroflexota bacterium]